MNMFRETKEEARKFSDRIAILWVAISIRDLSETKPESYQFDVIFGR